MLKGKIGFVVQRKSDGYFSVSPGGWGGVFWQARDAREARDNDLARTKAEYPRIAQSPEDFRIQKVLVVPFDCE